MPESNEQSEGALAGVASADLLACISALIEEEYDVKQVLELVESGDRYRYMIETPFESFPKFVIGTTDEHLLDVNREVACGSEWAAREEWKRLVG
jgi:hypothetical protein